MNSIQELKKVGSLSIVNPLVLETLEKLVDKKQKTARMSFESDLQQMYSAVTLKSVQEAEVIVRNLLDFGRSIELILDSYFPTVAERLGAEWVSDDLTFSEVTLALANLQLLSSKLDPLSLSSHDPIKKRGGNILIVVPKGEDHTFGAISVARKLRAIGAHTILAMNYQEYELENLLMKKTFDLIGISSGNNFMTGEINKLSTFFKTRNGKTTPVVLGGNLVHTYKKTNESLKVDLISDNPEYALDQFNINNIKSH